VKKDWRIHFTATDGWHITVEVPAATLSEAVKLVVLACAKHGKTGHQVYGEAVRCGEGRMSNAWTKQTTEKG